MSVRHHSKSTSRSRNPWQEACAQARHQRKLAREIRASFTRIRWLDGIAVALLDDDSPGRAAKLLALSDARVAEAQAPGAATEQAQVMAFEAAYLAVAALVTPDPPSELLHPSPVLFMRAMEVVALSSDDRFVFETLCALYGHASWDSLDRVATLEWSARVRAAAHVHHRYLVNA